MTATRKAMDFSIWHPGWVPEFIDRAQAPTKDHRCGVCGVWMRNGVGCYCDDKRDSAGWPLRDGPEGV